MKMRNGVTRIAVAAVMICLFAGPAMAYGIAGIGLDWESLTVLGLDLENGALIELTPNVDYSLYVFHDYVGAGNGEDPWIDDWRSDDSGIHVLAGSGDDTAFARTQPESLSAEVTAKSRWESAYASRSADLELFASGFGFLTVIVNFDYVADIPDEPDTDYYTYIRADLMLSSESQTPGVYRYATQTAEFDYWLPGYQSDIDSLMVGMPVNEASYFWLDASVSVDMEAFSLTPAPAPAPGASFLLLSGLAVLASRRRHQR